MSKILYFLLVIFIISNELFANNSYPYNIEVISVERGGKLIPKFENKTIKNYLFKPGWAGNTDLFTSWEGFNRTNSKVHDLGRLNLLKAELLDNNFLLIFEQNAKLFIALADTNLAILNINELHQTQQNFDNLKISLRKIYYNKYSLLLNGNLYKITVIDNNLKLQFIGSNIISQPVFLNNTIYFIKKNMFYQELRAYNQKNDINILSLQLPESVNLAKLNDELVIVSGSRFSDNSWLFFIKDNKIKNKVNLQTSPDKFILFSKNAKNYCYYINFENFSYYLVISEVNKHSVKKIEQIELPKSITELKKIEVIKGEIYLLFNNSLVIYKLNGEIISIVYLPFNEYFSDLPRIYAFNDLIYLSDFSNSIILKKIKNDYWWFYYYYEKLGNYTIIVLFVIIILLLYRKYFKQKIVSRALLDLPSSGVVLIIDKHGKLLRLNEPARSLLKITKDVPLKRLFVFYTDEKTEKLNNLIEKAILIKDGFREEIKIIEDDKFSEWVFTVFPINNMIGKISSFIITGINITEEIERKRIYNWAQLAHDMQTNLSTIKLNAEYLKCSDEEDTLRKKKILVQTNVLIHKVRDIVTVGRSDQLNLSLASSSEICHLILDEFDESLFPNIKIEFDYQDFSFSCDKAKILRALRNAIENGIKAIRHEQGKIVISIWQDSNTVYFSIKDNGIGMNETQLKKIKRPFYTTSKKEGGSGIGTMIIQNVVEQHGGEITYYSEINKGTEVIIKIPYINQ